MAKFEGEKNLNRKTSELEVKGKYKLSEEELDNVAGGCGETPEELAGCFLTGVTVTSDDGRVWEATSREPKCCPICASSLSFISAFGGMPTSWKYYVCSDGHLLCYSNGQ